MCAVFNMLEEQSQRSDSSKLQLQTVFMCFGAHASDCRGQVVTKTKSADGQTCTREAKLSIHDAELQYLDR